MCIKLLQHPAKEMGINVCFLPILVITAYSRLPRRGRIPESAISVQCVKGPVNSFAVVKLLQLWREARFIWLLSVNRTSLSEWKRSRGIKHKYVGASHEAQGLQCSWAWKPALQSLKYSLSLLHLSYSVFLLHFQSSQAISKYLEREYDCVSLGQAVAPVQFSSAHWYKNDFRRPSPEGMEISRSQTPELAPWETFMNATASRGHNCKQEELIRDTFLPISGLLPLLMSLYFSHLNSCSDAH